MKRLNRYLQIQDFKLSLLNQECPPGSRPDNQHGPLLCLPYSAYMTSSQEVFWVVSTGVSVLLAGFWTGNSSQSFCL